MRSAFEPSLAAQRRRHLLGAALGAALLPGGTARAQPAPAYPARSVRFIVPFPAGGPVDITGRALAQKLGEAWGQPTLVDNRAGAGGMVGAEAAARATPDGHTLFVCSIHHSVLPALRPKMSYDVERDFVPVSFAARFPVILVVHPSLPVKSVAELIALDRARPGTLSYGSSGNGGGTHLAGELFNLLAGTRLQHVPYKGSAPAMTDLLGNQVQIMFSDAPTALPQIKAGKVRALAVASPQRSALLPELPTVAETGLPGYEAYSWAGVLAPTGTPAALVGRLSSDIQQALNLPEVRQRLLEAGAEAAPSSPEAFGQLLRSEMRKWAQVVRAANIQMD
ncbi:tripartite tricarboxylate transporter substrate binding protein [Curvibacter sp. HBC28]|uniref:Tripartite tricarboxylate transporter substrate binding protein n=1 Tax=Curvibacter microcysteis TaxID=3026419 RepID=A0ABT5MBV1_9BURK|nr:tripartite tricarboxylate transporter substrate binding protein [Curvibacter sp. HBC28]MDD0814044.1 tripartite tricarboxylate transporter substrate binding protein [Curvibacter sp. HBC28]